ncbi:hypothetical protein D917_07059, partial [Trichinella nativa]
SVTCGVGVQQRAVECVYKDEVVDTGYCRDIAQPDRHRSCELIPCPEWEVSPWEQCSVTCGTGYQQRSVQCIYQENRMPAESGACVESKRPKVIRTVYWLGAQKLPVRTKVTIQRRVALGNTPQMCSHRIKYFELQFSPKFQTVKVQLNGKPEAGLM